MKNISKIRKSICFDILKTIMVVLISIPLWLSFDLSNMEAVAKSFDEYNYVSMYKDDSNYTLESISDKDALRYVPTSDIVVYNDYNTEQDYALVLKIDKSTNPNIDNIKINVNFNIKSLDEYLSYEDDEFIYFVIDARNIVASSVKYTISMWNKENTINNNVNYEFILENNLYA